MKIFNYKYMACATLLVLATSCNKDDDSSNTPDPTSETAQDTYVEYSVMGPIVNGDFRISMAEEDGYNSTQIIGTAAVWESNEGDIDRAEIQYAGFKGGGSEFRELTISFPTNVGEFALGEAVSGPMTVGNFPAPFFDMIFSFYESDHAVYDHNNDGSDDRSSKLTPKSVSVSITEYEDGLNNYGLRVLTKVKGSFEGTAFFEAYTGPTTDPIEVSHTITGIFELYNPVE